MRYHLKQFSRFQLIRNHGLTKPQKGVGCTRALARLLYIHQCFCLSVFFGASFRPAVLHLAEKMLSGHARVASLSLYFHGRSSWVWHHLLQMEGRQSLDEQIHCPWNWGSPPVKVDLWIFFKTLSLMPRSSRHSCGMKMGISASAMAILNHVGTIIINQ